jgi:putative ABC transport system permease protein
VLKHYFAIALRNVRSAPFVFAMNVLTLALGLACFVTAYAFVAFWESAEQHFANADRIAVLTTNMSVTGQDFSYEDAPHVPEHAARYLQEDFPAIETIARAVVVNEDAMIAAGDRALRSFGVAVDPEFLEIFELPFVAGDPRTALRNPRSVVLTKAHAAQLFGDRDPMGAHVILGNLVDATVTGVLDTIPEPSHLGRSSSAELKLDWLASFDVLEPIRADNRIPLPPNFPTENWMAATSTTYLLLPADGSLTIDGLRAQLPDFDRRHVPPELASFAQITHGAVPVDQLLARELDVSMFVEGTGMSVPLLMLVLGGLVLVVACVNYANLATARAARRTREVGLRRALGARGAQIAVQHLFEAAVLAVVSFAVALIVFRAVAPLIERFAGADLVPTLFAGVRFWAFLAAVVAGVTLAAGAYPALALSRVQPVLALRASRQQIGSKLLTTLLIGAQFAVASFLLIAVTITALQNSHLVRTGLATNADPLVAIENEAGMTKVDSATLREELVRIPQVRGVTEIGAAPWVNMNGTIVSNSDDPSAPTKLVQNQAVGLDFFAVFDIPLIAGRVFDRARDYARLEAEEKANAAGADSGNRDAGADADAGADQDGATPASPRQPEPIVVDRTFTAYLGFASPEAAVGQLVYFPGSSSSAFGGGGATPLEIVGVVENHSFVFFDAMGTTATMYRLQQRLTYQVARLRRDEVAAGLDAIDLTWRRLAPNVAVSRRFLDDYFNDAYESFLHTSRVFSGLAGLAFAISVSGLFGMATLIASRRMREIGVRKAHGATSSRIVAMLLASFSRPVLVANVVVWPAAYMAARSYLDTFVAPIALTPLPFMLSLAVTLLIAWLAVGAQTLRASRARPAAVLRYE